MEEMLVPILVDKLTDKVIQANYNKTLLSLPLSVSEMLKDKIYNRLFLWLIEHERRNIYLEIKSTF